jgi:diacylglycerol kinase family enzyme
MAEASGGAVRRVRVLVNPRSGFGPSIEALYRALERHWDVPGADLTYQASRSVEDGCAKARRAVADGVDTVLVVGGDGMVNSIGGVLVGQPVALGVIPAGSGNGFARHFGIPLDFEGAARALRRAEAVSIDVGRANGRPFLVTCGMAWDAALLRAFEQMPVRGILPYVLAGAYGLFEYRPQDFSAQVDGGAAESFGSPLVFTVANLTQYGGGARIAPQACPDDGYLELVVMQRQDTPALLAGLGRLFDGTIDRLREVRTLRFRRMVVTRERAAPIQVDGELVDAGPEVMVDLLPRALRVLAPRAEDAAG